MSGYKDRYCFIHLPKCAGTSVLRFLQASLGEPNVLHVHTPGPHAHASLEYLVSRHRMLVGHYEVANLPAWMFEHVFMFTFLRDPVDRVLSNYEYYRNVHHERLVPEMVRARELDLATLLRTTDLARPNVWSNWQTFALSGSTYQRFKPGTILEPARRTLDKLDFVGFYERLNADVKRLSETCGWDPTIPLPAANVTPNRKIRGAIDPETEALIRELNRDDIELYEYAQSLAPKPRPVAPPAGQDGPPWLTALSQVARTRKEHGAQEVVIEEVVIRGVRSDSDLIEQGDAMTIRMNARSTIDCSNLVAGIRISDPQGGEVYGTNTLLMDGLISVQPGQRFSVEFSCTANLPPGTFYLTIALHDADGREFHWIDNHSIFACVPAAKRRFTGRLDLKAKVATTILSEGQASNAAG